MAVALPSIGIQGIEAVNAVAPEPIVIRPVGIAIQGEVTRLTVDPGGRWIIGWGHLEDVISIWSIRGSVDEWPVWQLSGVGAQVGLGSGAATEVSADGNCLAVYSGNPKIVGLWKTPLKDAPPRLLWYSDTGKDPSFRRMAVVGCEPGSVLVSGREGLRMLTAAGANRVEEARLSGPEILGPSPLGTEIFLSDDKGGLWSVPVAGSDLDWESMSFWGIVGERGVQKLEFSHDGRVLAVMLWGGEVVLMATVDNIEIGRFTHTKVPSSRWTMENTFSPDDRYLAIAYTNGVVGVWDVSQMRLVSTLQHDQPAKALGFLAEGLLLTTSFDGLIRQWDVNSGKMVYSFDPLSGSVISGQKSLQGDIWAFGTEGGSMLVWDRR